MAASAFCIHVTEGVPVRRILETELNETGLIKVTITDCDWDWNKKGKSTISLHPAPRKTWRRSSEQIYHRMFRNLMSSQYSWRFEIYQQLSSPDV